ncbi:MAG TPA: hypothetical protein DCE42_07355 [Myxococcales bacterium]|nr:hypothetical protein [Deltaproteobacteria bacterium]MBU47292.1 hypothetical protein [Deltaproteobacteria bacterium]HAA54557.1 hypothetical protein [Myxococcales bacterium]|tara:strand:- start:178 stop:1059 length:882 start_codon:yes stop_codon:yes gene_type:complete
MNTKHTPRKPGRPKGSKNRKKTGASTQPHKAPIQEKNVLTDRQEIVHVPLSRIAIDDKTFQCRNQLRTNSLEKNIQEHGLQIPIILRPHPTQKDMYQIVSGFRRYTSIQRLGWDKISAIIREDLSDDKLAFKVSLIENEARRTYTDLDRGYAVVKYKDMGYDFEELITIFNVGKRQLSRLQSLTEFPELLQDALSTERIKATHAITLMTLLAKNAKLDLEHWINRIAEEKLSVSTLKKLIADETPTQKTTFYQYNETEQKVVIPRRHLKMNSLSKTEKKNIRKELESLLTLLK